MLRVNCLLLDDPNSEPFVIYAERDILTYYLRSYIYEKWRYFYTAYCLDELDLTLYRAPDLAIEPIESLHERANTILNPSLRIPEFKQLTVTISDNLLEGHIHVLVDTSELVKRPRGSGLDWTVEMRHSKALIAARNTSPPSEAALPEHIRSQQSDLPIYNGRSDEFRGPPVTIYCSAFADLRDVLTDISQVKITAEEMREAHKLIMRAVRFYDYGEQRIERMDPQLESLLGFPVTQRTTESGVITTRIHDSLALLACLGWRNELGSKGDAGYHAACSYREQITTAEFGVIRKRTCSPALILSMMGPYMCLAGAVFADEIIVQPFTDYIYLGGDPDYGDRVIYIARVFKAAKNALCDLRHYYERSLTQEGTCGPHLPQPSFMANSDPCPILLYFDRLFPHNPASTLFVAKMGRRDVVVKFTSQYCSGAHRLLAKHGLAPELHFCGRIRGGLWMVVMDYVPGDKGDVFYILTGFTSDILSNIQKALELLHKEDYVFGDLRPQNMIIIRKVEVEMEKYAAQHHHNDVSDDAHRPDAVTSCTIMNDNYDNQRFGAVLIDFDWCGKDSEARYPSTLNDTGDIGWAPGVERFGLMKKEHDEYLLRKLFQKPWANGY